MSSINLHVCVPVCSFRKAYAREYLETERVPPPATVYGFLLSLVGEEDRSRHIGSRLSLAVVQQPVVSTVLRTAWRVKNKKAPPGTGSNRRPDYQEILTGLEFAVWVAEGELADRLHQVARSPEGVERFGGLCLGESHDLVNEITFFPPWNNKQGHWLVSGEYGQYPLPVWVDHVGSKGTRRVQFNLQLAALSEPPDHDPRWITIQPP